MKTISRVLLMGGLSFLLVGGLSFKKEKEYILNDNIKQKEYNSIAMIQVDGEEEKTITKMPESGYVIDTENSYCILNGQKDHDSAAKLYTNSDGEHIIGNLAPEERCFVKFVKASEKTLAELDLHSQGEVEDFSKTACGGSCDVEENGIYETEDDFGTSYYFRGTVNDNWVKFGKMSTSGADIYWRIIRINGDGTIRLIYSGNGTAAKTGADTQIPSTQTFNASYNDNMYVGYEYKSGDMHGYKTGITKSNALTQLETWFTNNLSDEFSSGNGSIDPNAGFCNDRSGSTGSGTSWDETTMSDTGGTGRTDTYYGAYLRLVNSTKQPTLKCSTKNNKNKDYFTYTEAKGIESITQGKILGTQSLTYPIGLITADEVSFAGGVYGSANSGFWLYTSQQYWTMSPYHFYNGYALGFPVASNGDFGGTAVDNKLGLRPVINLKADTKFTFEKADQADKGTSSNPYIVATS